MLEIDAFEHPSLALKRTRDEDHIIDDGRNDLDTFDSTRFVDQLLVVAQPLSAQVGNHDMRGRAQNLGLDIFLESGDQGQSDNQGHDPDGNAQNRDESDHRDEGLLPLRLEVAGSDEELVAHRIPAISVSTAERG